MTTSGMQRDFVCIFKGIVNSPVMLFVLAFDFDRSIWGRIENRLQGDEGLASTLKDQTRGAWFWFLCAYLFHHKW